MNDLNPSLISFPFDGVDADGVLAYSRGNNSVREVILNILFTRPGERLMRPEFGAGLTDFIHHPNNETTRSLIADVVRRSIRRWEDRIQLSAVEVTADAVDPVQINIAIHYRLRYDRRAESLNLSLSLEQ